MFEFLKIEVLRPTVCPGAPFKVVAHERPWRVRGYGVGLFFAVSVGCTDLI
jgi:hypothetical protein